MSKDKQPQKEQIKVTDKRIFTADGDLREEFRQEIRPASPVTPPIQKPAAKAPEPLRAATAEKPQQGPGDRRRTLQDKAANPGTPFSHFVEPLIAQAYMSLGLLQNPYQPQPPRIDVPAARQMIDILTLLLEKTAGNLTPEEDDFLSTHVGELKLAFVKRTKSVG